MTVRYLIEEPSPFATREEWEKFLVEVRRLDQTSPEVVASIASAERQLAEMEGEAGGPGI